MGFRQLRQPAGEGSRQHGAAMRGCASTEAQRRRRRHQRDQRAKRSQAGPTSIQDAERRKVNGTVGRRRRERDAPEGADVRTLKIVVTVCLLLIGAGVVWWAVEDIKVLIGAWRAGEMPETSWFLRTAGLWWCAIAAAAVVSARTRTSRTKTVEAGRAEGNRDDGANADTGADR